jgi:hypothetical protein
MKKELNLCAKCKILCASIKWKQRKFDVSDAQEKRRNNNATKLKEKQQRKMKAMF